MNRDARTWGEADWPEEERKGPRMANVHSESLGSVHLFKTCERIVAQCHV